MLTEKEIIETDVLCIGGGIGGLMAAIRASEAGLKVTVVDKSNTLRSGAGATGCDHFICYIPETSDRSDMEQVIDHKKRGQMGSRGIDSEQIRVWFEKSFDIVKLWESWGIPMKYEGRYEFAGHSFPGLGHDSGLKYAGQMQKPILTREAKKRGVKIINRVMIFDLLSNDSIEGAIGIGTRDGKLSEFRAKSIILGTGTMRRLYPSPTPAWMFNLRRPGTLSGDGRAMAYRAGAELVNMEMIYYHCGPKYFTRSGQGTWVGVIKDLNGKPEGPFLTEPNRKLHDMIIEINKTLFSDAAKAGKGPLYMDCRGISDEDLNYFWHWMSNEGNMALLNHLKEEGIDLRKNPLEFMTYEPECAGTIRSNVRTETSISGLYATGDEIGNSLSHAATFGWIAGENAAGYARSAQSSDSGKQTNNAIEEKLELLDEIQKRSKGPDWKEANIALQQIMNDYAGSVRSETILQAGRIHLKRLKDKAYKTVVSKNPHELMRTLEVMNLFDLGELVFTAALERKETRGKHIRSDCTYTSPLMDKRLAVKRVENQPVTSWVD